jgi:hypothetical protein
VQEPRSLVDNCPYKNDNEEAEKKKDKKEKKEKKMTFKKKKRSGRREVDMWSLGIVIAPMIVMMMIQVMMTRGPSRRHLLASPSITSHPSSTLL